MKYLPPPAVLSLYIIILIVMQGWTLFLNQWDPFVYKSVIVITPQVKRGGLFIEELDVERNRVCMVDIDRFLIEDKTKNVILRERIVGGATLVGRNVARNSLVTPVDAPLGPVTLLQNVHSQCIDGTHSMQWPILHFEIVE